LIGKPALADQIGDAFAVLSHGFEFSEDGILQWTQGVEEAVADGVFDQVTEFLTGLTPFFPSDA
jgi:hypothetical protein